MSFADLLGHEAAIRLLKAQLERGVGPRTYLLVGPEGIGKRMLALEFSKALQCEALDVFLLEPQGNLQIGIEEIRALEAKVSLTPFGGQWKAAIVTEADRLTEEATHACLKILEEPPERTIFLLTAQALHRLPATLVSRCTVIRCAPQGVERVWRHLQEKEGMASEEARRLAVCSGGRLGIALRLHRTGGLVSKNEKLDQLLLALKKRTLEVPLGKAPREKVLEALEWYAAWWRDMLVLALGGDPAWVIHQDRLEELKRSKSSTQTLLSRIERTYDLHAAVERNVNLRTALAVLLSDACPTT